MSTVKARLSVTSGQPVDGTPTVRLRVELDSQTVEIVVDAGQLALTQARGIPVDCEVRRATV